MVNRSRRHETDIRERWGRERERGVLLLRFAGDFFWRGLGEPNQGWGLSKPRVGLCFMRLGVVKLIGSAGDSLDVEERDFLSGGPTPASCRGRRAPPRRFTDSNHS